jgi:hypothetical protein
MQSVLITLIICATALAGLVVVVLAFKPDFWSQRLEVLGWSTAGAGVVATLSPIDLIPDFLLGIGQLDDAAYLCAVLLCAALAYAMRRRRLRTLAPDSQLSLPFRGGGTSNPEMNKPVRRF